MSHTRESADGRDPRNALLIQAIQRDALTDSEILADRLAYQFSEVPRARILAMIHAYRNAARRDDRDVPTTNAQNPVNTSPNVPVPPTNEERRPDVAYQAAPQQNAQSDYPNPTATYPAQSYPAQPYYQSPQQPYGVPTYQSQQNTYPQSSYPQQSYYQPPQQSYPAQAQYPQQSYPTAAQQQFGATPYYQQQQVPYPQQTFYQTPQQQQIPAPTYPQTPQPYPAPNYYQTPQTNQNEPAQFHQQTQGYPAANYYQPPYYQYSQPAQSPYQTASNPYQTPNPQQNPNANVGYPGQYSYYSPTAPIPPEPVASPAQYAGQVAQTPPQNSNFNAPDSSVDAGSQSAIPPTPAAPPTNPTPQQSERYRPTRSTVAPHSKRGRIAKSERDASDANAVAYFAAAVGAQNVVEQIDDPERFLANIDANSIEANDAPAFDELQSNASESEESTDQFLQELSDSSEQQDNERTSANTLAMIRSQDVLERAVNDAPMWLSSLFLHLILVLILALIVTNVDAKRVMEIISEPGFSDQVVLDEVFDPDLALDANITEQFDVDASETLEVDSNVVADAPDVSAYNEELAAPIALVEDALGLSEAPLGDVENLLGSLNGDDLSGRGENKAAALAMGGGSEGSEKSVALALAWLAEHQLPDGSWTFNLRQCPTCGGDCTHSGSNNSVIAATCMGLLPFLAAGNTPTRGKYKKVVANGVNCLLEMGTETENGFSYRCNNGGNMYAHGLAAITLCETYAMLTDREKKKYRELGYYAQAAINFIEYAQADDGGWRYSPKQAGDTSVFGWQMMALKSAQLGGLEVSDNTVRGARHFLRDVVAFDYQTRYYYQPGSSESNATTSVGLLCRLYLDWRADNPDLLKGASRISQIGPQFNNPYYSYYAAQLMHNVGGEMWSKWNAQTRDALINSQVLDGHERGSWYPDNPDGHCATGGRLYATSLNCMILEVYYRHMPLYQRLENGSQFPLDLPANGDAKAEGDAPKENDE